VTGLEPSNTLKVGIAGMGVMGFRRAALCNPAHGVKLSGVAEVDKDKLDRASLSFGCPAYQDYDKMLQETNPDAVIICLPNNLHASFALRALERKINVFCEKPMAPSVGDCQSMVEAARRNGVTLKVGSNHRYFPNVIKARRLLEEGFLGEPIVFRGWIGHDGNRFGSAWFKDYSKAQGGALIDNGCHILDIGRWFMGQPTDCFARSANFIQKDALPAEDYAAAVYSVNGKGVINISASWLEWYGYFYFEVYGTEGFIIADSRFGNKLLAGKRADQEMLSYDFTNLPPQSYELEMDSYFSSLRRRVQPEPSGTDGMQVIRMIRAAYESSERGVRIEL
jgi:predicted dehydrogenase